MINILDERIVNKIAAGEVVERPASVVKELIENSLDADAHTIVIELKKFGKELIRVSDDGNGMNLDDAKLSIVRHATSKISKIDDLYNISTFGFRGEALSSIAAVSDLKITTKERGSLEGCEICVEGGKLKSVKSIGCPRGTVIEIKDLFFNVPARLKFLKSDVVELKHIADIVTRYALINNDVSFKLIHGDSILVNSPKSNELLYSIASLYGTDVVKQLVEVKYSSDFLKVQGYVSKPSLVRNDRSYQSIYVNRRYVKNETVSSAIYDAYKSLLFVNKHPVAVLNVIVDPSKVDVNVHPSKEIVKFEQDKEVYDEVYKAVLETLKNNNLFEEFGDNTPYTVQKTFSIGNVQSVDKQLSFDSIGGISFEEKEESFTKLPSMRILGQINRTYFVAENENGLMIIDQHIVQERVLYEKFMKSFLNENVEKQSLVAPVIVDLRAEDCIFVKVNLDLISKLGFDIEEFGDNSFIVRSVPSVFGRLQPKEMLFDIVTSFEKPIKEIKEEIITRMACRASIKAGDECSIPLMMKLLRELDETELPFTCPHGREIIVTLSFDDIEKRFRRK